MRALSGDFQRILLHTHGLQHEHNACDYKDDSDDRNDEDEWDV
jgi:hypothetical protein